MERLGRRRHTISTLAQTRCEAADPAGRQHCLVVSHTKETKTPGYEGRTGSENTSVKFRFRTLCSQCEEVCFFYFYFWSDRWAGWGSGPSAAPWLRSLQCSRCSLLALEPSSHLFLVRSWKQRLENSKLCLYVYECNCIFFQRSSPPCFVLCTQLVYCQSHCKV